MNGSNRVTEKTLIGFQIPSSTFGLEREAGGLTYVFIRIDRLLSRLGMLPKWVHYS